MTLRQRISRARKAYRSNPSDARLRTYLTLKAKAGVFDKRMCAYYNVDANVCAAARKAICRAYAAGLVPTSTTGGSHAPGSFHFKRDGQGRGCGVDFGVRRSLIGTRTGQQRLSTFQRQEFWRFRKGRVRFAELIGPDNRMIVLRGRDANLAEGTALETAHDNHVHEGFYA